MGEVPTETETMPDTEAEPENTEGKTWQRDLVDKAILTNERAKRVALGQPWDAGEDTGESATQILDKHLGDLSDSGVAGSSKEDLRDRLPGGPGFRYINHLFRKRQLNRMKKKMARETKADREGMNIYVDQPEALKTALLAIGIYSDKNPGGMPIELKTARQIWFGGKEISDIEEAEWRSLVETGDKNLDSKRTRKFVNYDGSITWELLNEDKTVMSRFTIGEYGGTKVFSQGGYSKFAEALDKVKQERGSDRSDFEDIRGKFARGL